MTHKSLMCGFCAFQLCHLKEGADTSLTEQLSVVEFLRREEQAILGQSQELLGLQRQPLPSQPSFEQNQVG